jgi:MFS family permease
VAQAAAASVKGGSPLVTLAAVQGLEAGERSSLSQAVDGIQAEFDVSDSVVGLLPAAMAIVGTLGAVPFGYLADRHRRTWLLAMAMTGWVVVMGLNAAAPVFAFLFAVRLGVGIVEANGPAAISLLCDYYPVRERARVIGLWNSGALVGALVGLGLGGVLVDQLGWRAAFWMWIPLGLVVVAALLRLPEPRRGQRDVELEALAQGSPDGVGVAAVAALALPEPGRAGSLRYDTASWRECLGELLRIRSMWLAVIGITVSQALLNGLAFWAVPFFKRTYDLTGSAAGVAAAAFGIGAAIGMVGGGIVADRLLRRGIVNARIYVVVTGAVMTSVCLTPAFAMRSFAASFPLIFLGAIFLTMSIAPVEAIMTDVVVAPMRGRAAAVRAVVKSLSQLSAPLIGVLADVWDLRTALFLLAPLSAIGGLIVLSAARTYPSDLAFVVAESRRLRTDVPVDDP